MFTNIIVTIGLVFMAILGHDHVTANGSVTIPTGCVYVVATCEGTIDPPYLNGNLMDTKGTVAAQGVLKAIGIHVRTFPTVQTIPFAMNGADRITFIYLDAAVCTRGTVVSGFNNSTGQVTGALPTSSTTDLVIAIAIGANGQVTLKGDTVDFTLLLDETLCRIGSIVPGDTSLTCLSTDGGAATGYWYTPPAVFVPGALISEGYYSTVTTIHTVHYVLTNFTTPPNTYYYDIYIDGTFSATLTTSVSRSDYTYNTYAQVWHPAVYSSGYWTYPPQQWIVTGTSGSISCIYISIADVMIGGIYVSRPLIC
jgi:hypothetical protein